MTHRSFGTVKAEVERDPITFDFGLFGTDTFTVIPTPSLGDTFDLSDAPEPTPQNVLESAKVCARFIRRMLDPDDRDRFDAALYKIPADRAEIIVETAAWIAGRVSPFPSKPSGTSAAGRRTPGKNSKPVRGGRRH